MNFATHQHHESNLSKAEQILLTHGLCVCTARQLRDHIGAALQAASRERIRNEMQAAQAGVQSGG
jgi:hypothetical protein